ncbi:MAG: A/G-specific adenine glycosylase [Akkermansiaceae bacterium]
MSQEAPSWESFMEKKSRPKQPLSNLTTLRKALHSWFANNGKDLPWRRTRDPWHILVSEIMLQQTTVTAVIANRRFEKFLNEFPDLETISSAKEEKLLKAWEGLGYYNRVRNLQKTAITVLTEFDGDFPQDAKTLETLPGIGKYTAGAVASFAFDQPTAIVDANVARVLSRLFDYHKEIDTTAGQRQIWSWAGQLLDPKNPRLFNSALMELGQTHCSAKNPGCLLCPLNDFCQSSSPETLPRKKPRQKMIAVNEHALLCVKRNRIFLTQEKGPRRKGFWRLPLTSAEETAHLEAETEHRYIITHHKVTVFLYRVPSIKYEGQFFTKEQIEKLPIPSPIRRIIKCAAFQ